MAKKKIINEGGVIGSGKGLVNTNSNDFLFLKAQIAHKSIQQSKKQLVINHFLALRYQMDDYLLTPCPAQIIPVGTFLKQFLNVIDLKHKLFAKYIGIENSNLSALLKGRRKLNLDIALKLEKIFNAPSSLWLNIQNKNELLIFQNNSTSSYDNYNLDDLLKQAG
jgi:addiction module HigA family antidote